MDSSALILQLSEWLGVVAVTMLAGTSARFVRRPIVFRYPARERRFGLLVGLAAVVLAFVYFALQLSRNAELPIPRLILAALCAAIALAVLRMREQPIRSAGWGQQTLRPAVYLGLSAGLLAIFLRGRFFSVLSGAGSGGVVALILWLGISLAEETVFRGYIQPRLSGIWGVWVGGLASALIFTLYSLPLKLALAPEQPGLLLGLLITFIQGLVLAFMAHKSGHVLAPALYRALSQWINILY